MEGSGGKRKTNKKKERALGAVRALLNGPARPILAAHKRAQPMNFFIFILFFSIYQNYIPIFFFKFVTLPPVHPADASYRQMDRR